MVFDPPKTTHPWPTEVDRSEPKRVLKCYKKRQLGGERTSCKVECPSKVVPVALLNRRESPKKSKSQLRRNGSGHPKAPAGASKYLASMGTMYPKYLFL